MKRQILALGSVILFGVITTATTFASEIGHFAPGVPGIRDLAVPPPGLYAGVYNYRYSTSRLNDANGNQVSSVTLTGPGGQSATLNVGIDVDMYALVPMFI